MIKWYCIANWLFNRYIKFLHIRNMEGFNFIFSILYHVSCLTQKLSTFLTVLSRRWLDTAKAFCLLLASDLLFTLFFFKKMPVQPVWLDILLVPLKKYSILDFWETFFTRGSVQWWHALVYILSGTLCADCGSFILSKQI